MSAPRLGPQVLLAAVIAAVLAAPGCSKKTNRLPVYPVKGQVLVGEKPAKGVRVYLWPSSPGGRDAYCPQGETDEGGYFSLSTYDPGDGAPAGDYKITAEWPVRFNTISNRWEGDKLKGRFRDHGTSPLTATVRPEPNELPVIKLTP
jgi:hypothetical protein